MATHENQDAPPRKAPPTWTVVLAAVGVFGAGVAVYFASGLGNPPRQAPLEPPPTARGPQEDPEERARRDMGEMQFADAMAYARPFLADTDQAHRGLGLLRFFQWASQRMQWPDVALAADEITAGEAAKDADGAIGKRLCVTGSVFEIRRDREVPGQPFTGSMLVGAVGLRFVAFGSTQGVVAGTQARFCGVVLGQYAAAAELAGFFDVPANRPTAPAPVASSLPKRPGPRSAADKKLLDEMLEPKGGISADDIAKRQREMSAPPR